MKIKFNLVGTTFTHLTGGNKGYSVHGKTSRFVEWVKEDGAATFYIDRTLAEARIDKRPGPKFGWLLESKFITPQIVDNVKIHLDRYLEVFDLIFTHNRELLALDDKFKWVPAQGFWIQEPKFHEKTRLVSMITSNKRMCQGHIDRLEWVEKFKDKIDLYGRGFNEIKYKEEGLCDYMYSIAIENGQYETYYTEKLLDCFATGTIPIYLGAPDIGNHFNSDGIITLTDDFDISMLNREDYDSRYSAIWENLETVKSMYPTLEDFIYKAYLENWEWV